MKNSNIERKLPAEKRILSGNHFLSAEAVLIILCHHEKTIQFRVKKIHGKNMISIVMNVITSNGIYLDG